MRVYADTSVFGGPFDEEFERGSALFFEQVRAGYFVLVTSAVVSDELEGAPLRVRSLFASLEPLVEVVEITGEAEELQRAYLEAGILKDDSSDDALHIALATATGCTAIVSWNFKHMVNVNRVRMFNAVSALHGYSPITICTPAEVVDYEEKGL
jgi:predicted nucleic acid-binding protein